MKITRLEPPSSGNDSLLCSDLGDHRLVCLRPEGAREAGGDRRKRRARQEAAKPGGGARQRAVPEQLRGEKSGALVCGLRARVDVNAPLELCERPSGLALARRRDGQDRCGPLQIGIGHPHRHESLDDPKRQLALCVGAVDGIPPSVTLDRDHRLPGAAL